MIHNTTAFLSCGLSIDFLMVWAQHTTLPHHGISCEYTFPGKRPNITQNHSGKVLQTDSKTSKGCYDAAKRVLYNRYEIVCCDIWNQAKWGGGRSRSRFDKKEHALISCAGCDPALPCTVPQGYCRALTILFPIFTSSVLPTTANGKWLCGSRKSRVGIQARHLCTCFLSYFSLRVTSEQINFLSYKGCKLQTKRGI